MSIELRPEYIASVSESKDGNNDRSSVLGLQRLERDVEILAQVLNGRKTRRNARFSPATCKKPRGTYLWRVRDHGGAGALQARLRLGARVDMNCADKHSGQRELTMFG